MDRMIKFSGSQLPPRLIEIIEKFGSDGPSMMEAGIEYATEQIAELYANGHNFAHVYTMNKIEVSKKIKDNLEYMLTDFR
jgi:methylenetetrahydrofolate reductase (NADPH)